MISCPKFALSDLKQMSNNAFWDIDVGDEGEIDIGDEECITQLQTVNIRIQHNMSCLILFFHCIILSVTPPLLSVLAV